MEMIDQEKYLKGKKQFCILAILNIPMSLIPGAELGTLIVCLEAVLFLEMFVGEKWPIYLVIGLSLLESFDGCMALAGMIGELDWIIYVWPGVFIMRSLGAVWCLSACILAIFGKNLRYFINVNKMESKRRKAEQAEQKDNEDKTDMEA